MTQRIVGQRTRAGQHRAPAVLQAGDFRRHMAHTHALEEWLQRHDELLARAQAAGDPDDAGQVVQLGARRTPA
jgi:hypothetical protein